MRHDTLWMAKKLSFAFKTGWQKSPLVHLLTLVVLAFVLSLCTALFRNESVFWAAQSLLFLTTGLLLLWKLNTDWPTLTVSQRWVLTFSLAGTACLLFGLFFLWQSRFSWWVMLVGPAAFLLPFVLTELYRLYWQLSYAGAGAWVPTTELQASYPDIYVNGIPVRFVIIQGEAGADTLTVNCLPSVRMRPGEILADISQKRKKQGESEVHFMAPDGRPYQWIFLTRDQLLWRRPLQPLLTLSQNKVHYGYVVYAMQVNEGLDFNQPNDSTQ